MAEPQSETLARPVDGEHEPRLARLISKQFGFVWRLLRRIGIAESEADSAAQEVFATVAQRLADVRPGSERSFLFGTTLHVAAQARRNREAQTELSDSALALEDLDEQQQAREVLGALLEQMPLELRVVFVLHEIERLDPDEIAEVVGIPTNEVRVRLTDAREDFATHLETDSDYSLALIAAAREEQAPPQAVSRALEAAGLSPALFDASAGGAAPDSARVESTRPAAQPRSLFKLAAKWLVLGWVAGLVVGSALYALSDAARTRARPGSAAH